MRNFHLRRQHKFRPEINLDKLWSLVGAEKFAELEKEKSTKAPVIDLVKFVSFVELSENDAKVQLLL